LIILAKDVSPINSAKVYFMVERNTRV